MSDSSNSNKYYVPTPIAANYEAANSEVLLRTSKFGTKTHRLFSAKGENANIVDQGATNFKYLEDTMFSNTKVKLHKATALSMFDDNYLKEMRKENGCVCKVLRFDRSHNIRSFDFIITYSQLTAFGADIYKPIVLIKQFKGTLLFTGCSIIRDTDTKEELPLKLYGKYESIGDTANNTVDIDANMDSKGGPTIKVKYTFDSKYVYVFLSGVSPFRLIPIGDGEFVDISYAEGKGSLVGETKENFIVTDNPLTGTKKAVSFSGDSRVWFDVNLSLKDTTISHDVNNAEFVDYDEETMGTTALALKEQEIEFIPTNDGEQVVINMEPASTVNLEIAPDIKPIRFGSNLLNSSKPKIKSYIETLKNKIIESAINIEKVPFSIQTTIRNRGKYNINGNFFIDSQADSFGNIIITDVGVYDSITGTFDIIEYIFDKNQTKYTKLNTVKNYNDYKKNASDYLTSISAVDETTGKKPEYSSVRKTNQLLDILTNIDFENPTELDVYFNVAFVKNTYGFNVLSAYAEFGEEDSENSDDNIVYFCKDNKIRIVNFKDYNMENVKTIDLVDRVEGFNAGDEIAKIDKSDTDGHFTYYLGTSNGLIITIDNVTSNTPDIKVFGAFDSKAICNDKVTLLNTDNTYVFVGSENGNVSIINVQTKKIKYLPNNFRYGDEILAAKNVDNDHLVFISKTEICSYRISSNKWNFEGDTYRTNAIFDNPYNGLNKPNIDLIIEKEGWSNVPVIQKDNFVYAFGMRFDRDSGYYPVYKKLNLLTGEVAQMPIPSNVAARVFKAKLCTSGRYIYSVGGTSVSTANDPLETRTKTYISVFDTITEKWIEDGTDYVELGDGIILDESYGYFPVAYGGKIWIIHPKTNVISRNENTESYVINTKRVYKSYRIDVFSGDTLAPTVTELPAEINNVFVNIDINIVPIIQNNGKIIFFSGHPDTTNNDFNGYYLEKYIFDPVNETVSLNNFKCGTEYELVSSYNEGKFADAPADLFGNFSFYTQTNEACVFCLERFVIYILSPTEASLYTETHAIYHNINDSALFAHPPLISSGDFGAWKKYNKIKPSNINLLKIDNYIYFIGGTTARIGDVLSLDSMSLIPAPRYFERLRGVPESSALADSKEVLEHIAIEDNFTYKAMSSCKIKNTMYFIVTDTDNRQFLMKYTMDDPSAKPILVARIDEAFGGSTYRLSNIVMVPVKDLNVIVFASINAMNLSNNENEIGKIWISAYNLNDDTIANIVEGSERFSNDKAIYSFSPETAVVDFVSDSNIGIRIKVLGGIISTEYINVGTYQFNSLANKIANLKLIKSVEYGKVTYFATPKNDSVDVEKLDLETKTVSVIKSLPDSGNYEYPDIFRRDNVIYVTKGINGALADNNIYSIGSNGEFKHALLGFPANNLKTPFAISRKNNLYVFGIDSVEPVILRVLKSKVTDDTFVDYNTIIDINFTDKSVFNRFNPNFTTFYVDGHELLAVFGGTESLSVPTTNTIDIFDVNKHIWSQPINLPERLSHISIVENEIIGATKEIVANASKAPYNKKLTLKCNSYESLSFEVVELNYPEINGLEYPTYAKYAYDATNKIVYVIGLKENGCIKNDPTDRGIYRIDVENAAYTAVVDMPEIIYTDTTFVIGAYVENGLLVVATYSFATNTISVFTYNSSLNIWNEVKKISLSFVPRKTKESNRAILATLSAFNKKFNAIKNNTLASNATKAIVSVIGDDAIYGIYIGYKGSVIVSNCVKILDIEDADKLDKVYVNSEGFCYLSNRTDNKLLRCYPNNDVKGFGIKNLNVIDADKTAVARTTIGSKVYALYTDQSTSIIDIETGVRTDIAAPTGFDGVISNSSLFGSKDGVNGYFIVHDESTDTYTLVNIKIDNTGAATFTGIGGLSDLDHVHHIKATKDKCLMLIIKSTEVNDIVVIGSTGIEERRIAFPNPTDVIPLTDARTDGKIVSFVNSNGYFKLFIDTTETDEIKLPVIVGTGAWFYLDSTIFFIDNKGKVLKIDIDPINAKFTGCQYVTKTDFESISTNGSKTLVFYPDCIVDIDRGIRFAIADKVDNDHYCFSKTAVVYNDEKIVTIINVPDDNTYVCVHDFATHKMLSKIAISTPVDISNIKNAFVCKSGSVLKYTYILNGKIQTINCSTGEVNDIENADLVLDNDVYFLPHANSYIVGNGSNSYQKFDPTTQELTTVNINFNNFDGVELVKILSATRYANSMFGLFKDTAQYYIGKIAFTNTIESLHLIALDGVITKVKKVNSIFVAENTDGKIFTFVLDEANVTGIIKAVEFDRHYSKQCVDRNALLSFDGVVRSKNTHAFVAANGYVVEDSVIAGLTDVQYRQIQNYVVIYGTVSNDNTDHKLIFVNVNTGVVTSVNTDIALSKYFVFEDMRPLHDEIIDGGITKIGHIVDVIGDEIRSFSVKVTDPTGVIHDYSDMTTVENNALIANDDTITRVAITGNYAIVPTQNRYVAIFNNGKMYTVTLSSAWRVVTNTYNIGFANDIFSSRFNVFKVADLIYLSNPTTRKTIVMCVPSDGITYNITESDLVKEITLAGRFYNIINGLLSSDNIVFDAENDRVCGDSKIGVYFNTIKNCSEYYNNYIGVTGNGEVINTEIPISEYEISGIDVNDETNLSTLRSNENLKTTISLMYKSQNKNIVSEINAISRLNTTDFKVLYSKTNGDEIGEVYAFVNTENNGILVRDDTAYYRGDYAVAIINSAIIKIKVDNEIYTYYRTDNEIPLANDIVPIIIVYDERTNSNNEAECRYLSFVDVKGNLVTYDKELKTFIDVSGYVDVDIPYFSTEAIIFPSKSNLLSAENALVEKEVKATS